MTALLRYMEAWVAHDADRVAGMVAEDCCVIESYGPVYRGRSTVRRWARTWFRAGGLIHDWTITDHFTANDREAAQWRFSCTWGGVRSTFDGATVASSAGGLITTLREYQTAAPLYPWDGLWR